MNKGFSKDQDQDHHFFGSRHLQLFEHILQDEAYLGASSIEQEQPGQKGHIDDTKQDTKDIVGHGVPIKTNNMYRFAVETHTTKDQPIKNRNSESQDIENAKTDANNAEIICEGSRIGLVPQQVMHGTANEHHRCIQPKRSISTSMNILHIVIGLEISKEPS